MPLFFYPYILLCYYSYFAQKLLAIFSVLLANTIRKINMYLHIVMYMFMYMCTYRFVYIYIYIYIYIYTRYVCIHTQTHTHIRDRKGSRNEESNSLSFIGDLKYCIILNCYNNCVVSSSSSSPVIILLSFCYFRCKFFVAPFSLLGYLTLQYWTARYFHACLMLHAARITAACTCLCIFFWLAVDYALDQRFSRVVMDRRIVTLLRFR